MKKLMVIVTLLVTSLLFGCGGGGGGSGSSSNNSDTASNSADSGTGGSTGGTANPVGGTGDSAAGVNGGGAGDTGATPVQPPAAAIPGAPAEVMLQPGNGQVTLSWNPVADATSYNVYWSTASGAALSQGARKTGAVSPCLVTGLQNGTTYYFVVTAANQYGESRGSAEMSAAPAVFFVAEMVSGKSFDYTFSTGAAGTVSFNADGTFTGQNLSVGMPLTGQWVIKDGVLTCVYPGGITETLTLISSTSTSFIVTYFVTYADGSSSNSVEGTFVMK
ncbi:fibronectin type III domain-containing protein [Citrifermentans bremense]|uniref:fibronectin type III domain-containing protein n=1 Tax=Citrifermentans bremense TaxID=60035 RepID=UPI00047D2EF9|nr:fibronectin type III domain-containing protein [Citrifermentans bremense]